MYRKQEMQLTPFSDGQVANIFTLTNKQGSSITVMDVGATWLSCKIKMQDELREVLLGIDSMEKHLQQQVYLGATVGRYANRIKHGKFEINGQCFQTSINQADNTLHGGLEGFDKRRWQVVKQEKNKIIFSLLSKDGDQGFPGNLAVMVSYHFNDQNEVSIEYRANTDKTCPVNLTNHAYFNLLGAEKGQNCLTHRLQIKADRYAPNDEKGIPLGSFPPVTGSSFDFVQEKVIKQDFLSDLQQQNQSGYDHSFLLNGDQDSRKVVLTLTAPDRSIQLAVSTSKPALHLYTGNFLQGTPARGERIYGCHAGIALETQYLPDAPNNLQWSQPCPYLQPEQTYQSTTRYSFSVLSKDKK
ncbi:MAG: galactose-1-epimerase [Colwellia sp.]